MEYELSIGSLVYLTDRAVCSVVGVPLNMLHHCVTGGLVHTATTVVLDKVLPDMHLYPLGSTT